MPYTAKQRRFMCAQSKKKNSRVPKSVSTEQCHSKLHKKGKRS